MGKFRRRQSSVEDQSAALDAEVAILRQMLLHYPPGQRPNFGAPTRCPSCGDFGFVAGLDQAQGASFNECYSCGARWLVTRRALRALREELRTTGSVRVHHGGEGQLLLGMPDHVSPLHDRDPRAGLLVPGPATAWLADATRGSAGREPGEDVDRSRRDIDAERDAEHDAERDARQVADRDDEPVSPLVLPSGPRLDVLLVEDSEMDAELIKAILAPVTGEISLYHATTSKEGKALFAHRTVDIVLLDLGLPDSSGIETLKSWRHTGLPIAVVTGDDDLALASAVKRAGAVEFVPKRRLANLVDGGAEGTDELADIIRRTALSRP